MSGYNVTASIHPTPAYARVIAREATMSYNEPMMPFLAAFGLTDRSRLPVEGAAPRIVNGMKVWINPLPSRLPTERHWKRSTHRFMCECPNCGKVLSVGRIRQHVCATQNPTCWCGHTKNEHHNGNDSDECSQCECAMYDRAGNAPSCTSDREDFHSDEAIGSVADEPNFPDV